MDEKLATILIFCDISKAFDRVWHLGLLVKLRSYGISGDLLNWISDYITDRRQIVFVENEFSSVGNVKTGVPQGSVLGPLLFLLYINDITDNIDNLARLFADDTSLSYSGLDFATMEQNINIDLGKLHEWSKTWLVDFNPKKTKALVVSNTDIPDLNIKFDNENVEIVDNHKHLGVTFSNDGNWTTHIENIVNSAFKQVNVLRKLKFILSSSCLSKMDLSYIRPLLEYACEVWDGCYEREIEKLEKVQLEAARIVTGLTKYASKDALYFETGWEPLADRRKFRKLTIFYKMHNRECPDYLYNCLPPTVSNTSGYNLRNNENYTIPRTRLRLSEKSFIPSTVSLWNNLDISVRNSPTLNNFKCKIKDVVVKPPDYYRDGTRRFNILHTRLRHQCSSLRADLFRVNLVNDPKCSCGAAIEDSIHYFFECPLYQEVRRRMFCDLRNINMNIEILLFGDDTLGTRMNVKIFEKVRTYIKQTKRF